MTTNTKQIKTLIANVLSAVDRTDDLNDVWNNKTIQKNIKNITHIMKHGCKNYKDPNAPKRSKSAYLFFCLDTRERVKRDLGDDASATAITKELGKRWKKLKESKKSCDKKLLVGYEEQAATDKVRYEKEKDEYNANLDNNDCDQVRRGGKKNARTGPKRAKSAYLFFCDVYRSQVKENHSNYKASQITTELGKMWNELKSDSSRKDELIVFEEQAAKDRKRYETEKAQQTSSTNVEVEEVVEEEVVIEEQVAKDRKRYETEKAQTSSTNVEVEEEVVIEEEVVEEEPKKFSGYQKFCNENRKKIKKEHPKLKSSDVTKKLSSMWKSLTKEEQNEYK